MATDAGRTGEHPVKAKPKRRWFQFGLRTLLDRAIADYTAAIRINPKFGTAYLNRAGVYVAKGDLDKAQQDFDAVEALERVRERNPSRSARQKD
jgi:tetratricopeptide (TPR) repeat protein